MLQDSSFLHVLLSLLHCICVSSKELGFAAASVSAVSESTNRQADMSVQYVTRRVCCSFYCVLAVARVLKRLLM